MASQNMGSFSPSQLPLGNASLVLIPFLPLFFFLLFSPVMSRVSCPFWRFKFFCQHSVDVQCESFYMKMCFIDVFVGEGESDLLLLCHLQKAPKTLLKL